MPSGTWTTYGDVAELIGSHPVPVGAYLGSPTRVIGAYRVLAAEGRTSPSFRWADGGDRSPPQELLASEGVHFAPSGRARPSRRLSAAELATLPGRDVAQPAVHDPLPDGEDAVAAERFHTQLRENWPAAHPGVVAALDFWRRQGGHVTYGRHEETSCFPTLDLGTGHRPHLVWPVGIYPVSGTVEAVFQDLKSRCPFDDTKQRRELLNGIDGIDLPEAKSELRPSFPSNVFEEHGDEICGVLDWFVGVVARPGPEGLNAHRGLTQEARGRARPPHPRCGEDGTSYRTSDLAKGSPLRRA
ncbi:MGMT family protein [Streptomyces sp. NPDC058872]|uniref:MGMT family protein n=1 Tax=Streptomyces sp. NPDC058872 TaxID=3346661 RepID=UPI0036C132DF